MPFTLEQLYEMGAQNTIQSLVLRGEPTLAAAKASLGRRFGAEIFQSSVAVGQLYRQVVGAVSAGELITLGQAVETELYGLNPALAAQYRYSVIASLPDPLEPGKIISIPWKIDSPNPLEPADILSRAENELNESMSDPNLINRSGGSDLQNRKMRFASALGTLRQPVQGQEPVNVDIALSIIAAYRRS